MIRIALEDVILFLIPFGLFGLVLVVLRRDVLHLETWSKGAVWLLMAGFAVVIGWTVLGVFFSDRHTGAYVPPHMEGGRPVPGGFK